MAEENIEFEYEGPTDIAPFKEIMDTFVKTNYKIVARYTIGGKHVEINVYYTRKGQLP